jgi:hypothetical protein
MIMDNSGKEQPKKGERNNITNVKAAYAPGFRLVLARQQSTLYSSTDVHCVYSPCI